MNKLLQRLQDAAKSGVYRTASDAGLRDAAEAGALALVRIALGPKATLMRNVAAALEVPAGFGANWDALEDSLSDLSWSSASSHVLVFENPDAMPQGDRDVLLDVLQSVAEFWAGEGRPFFAVFVDPQRRLPLPELHREK